MKLQYAICLIYRYMGGKKTKGHEIEGLEEMMTICGICNDSSVDYNDVSTHMNLLMFALKFNKKKVPIFVSKSTIRITKNRYIFPPYFLITYMCLHLLI